MYASRSQWFVGGRLSVLLAALLVVATTVRGEDKTQLDLDKIPKQVMQGLKARFPKAEIQKWTKEKEGDIVVYDFEFKQEGRKFEADIKDNGTIHNWEREIAAKDLPAVVAKAVRQKHPQATIREVMEITAVMGKKEALEGYEVVLETADKTEVEVMVAPDGKFLEDSPDEK